MGRYDKMAHTIATGLLSAASRETPFGLISFNDRVYLKSYYSSHPTPLLAQLNGLGVPRGVTELADAMMVAICADNTRPKNLYVISDNGENASEVPLDMIKSMLRTYGVEVFWIKPPPASGAHILPFLAEPPGRMKLLDALGAKVVDLSKLSDEPKFLEAVTRMREGRIRELVG
jgi:hypothetical protein